MRRRAGGEVQANRRGVDHLGDGVGADEAWGEFGWNPLQGKVLSPQPNPLSGGVLGRRSTPLISLKLGASVCME